MDDSERRKAQLDGCVADRQLGKVLGMLPTVAAGSNPAHWGELLEAAEKIRQADARVLHDEVTSIAWEANRISEKANGLSEKANRLAREANQGSKRARCTAWVSVAVAVLSFAVAVGALAAQLYPLVH